MKLPLISAAILTLGLAPLHGQLLFDQNVTPDVIFGSGNANGGWTVDQDSGIELGLRAKLRYDENGVPQNIFNSNGDGSYDFLPGSYTASSRPNWNFEWSVNSNFDGTGGVLSNFTYVLSLDTDPSAATNFSVSWDPINVLSADHALGTNATGNGGGTVDTVNYLALISANNVAQNSWSYHWFDAGFDPYAVGQYTIKLDAYDRTTQGWLAGSEILVNVVPVPEPATIGLLSMAGLGAVMYLRRRRKQPAA